MNDKINLLCDVIDIYYNYHPSGGSLHIVLDEGCCDRSGIEFCLKYAAEKQDYVGVAIAQMLLEMPDEIMAACKEDWLEGIDLWHKIPQ